MKRSSIALILGAVLALRLSASPAAELDAVNAETLRPFTGTSVRLVDPGTLTGKVMCGYQGWFNAEGDGAGRGFHHWSKGGGPLLPGNAKIDLLPDVSELGAEERFSTGLRHADGSMAEVFSAFKQATVLRHFQWLRDYGIDGVFVQRFIAPLRDAQNLRHNNVVLDHCREGANRYGRTYAVMYDLSGLGKNRIAEVADDTGTHCGRRCTSLTIRRICAIAASRSWRFGGWASTRTANALSRNAGGSWIS